MNFKKWLTATGAGVLVSGMLLAGFPAAGALAAGGPPAGVQPVQYGGCGLQVGRTFGSMAQQVAQFLGIDLSQLIAARQSGQSLVQIAEERGSSEQALVDYVVGQRSAQIDQLVEDGKITRAQADLQKQFMAERVKENVNRTTVGPNFPGSGGQGFKAGGKSGSGPGSGAGRGRAGMGAGFGARAGICPYYSAPAN